MTKDEFATGLAAFQRIASEVGIFVNLMHADYFQKSCILALRKSCGMQVSAPLEYWFNPNFLNDLPGTSDYRKASEHFLASVAARLVQPNPHEYLTRSGTVIVIEIHWPFHFHEADYEKSVHALVQSCNPIDSECAVLAAIRRADESQLGIINYAPPVVEGFIINSIRKAIDDGSLQMHPVGTRPDHVQKIKIPGQTTHKATTEEIKDFILQKLFWLGYERGGVGCKVNFLDPYDIRYLRTNKDRVEMAATELRSAGLLSLDAEGGTATVTDAFLNRADDFRARGRRTAGPRSESPDGTVATGHAEFANSPVLANYQYDAFICHASEDKTDFVLPLAHALQERKLSIWLDRFCLTIGDSLRKAIDLGLAHSRYGIVVLSHNFFRKRWPQAELDGLLAREQNGTKVILPIWHRITRADVETFSPILAGRIAAESRAGLDAVIDEILEAMSSHRPLTNTPMPSLPGDMKIRPQQENSRSLWDTLDLNRRAPNSWHEIIRNNLNGMLRMVAAPLHPLTFRMDDTIEGRFSSMLRKAGFGYQDLREYTIGVVDIERDASGYFGRYSSERAAFSLHSDGRIQVLVVTQQYLIEGYGPRPSGKPIGFLVSELNRFLLGTSAFLGGLGNSGPLALGIDLSRDAVVWQPWFSIGTKHECHASDAIPNPGHPGTGGTPITMRELNVKAINDLPLRAKVIADILTELLRGNQAARISFDALERRIRDQLEQ